MPSSDEYAAQLHAMVDAPAGGGGTLARHEAVEGDEHRSIENPSFAVNPAQLDALIGYGPTRSGVQINEHTALTFGAVFCAIKILAESLAMLPLVVYEGDEDTNKRVRAVKHPAYNLLRREPNPEMSAPVWMETMGGHIAGWGNCFSRIVYDKQLQAKQIIPLLADRTFAERVGGNLRYRSTNANGGTDYFAPEEIIHVPLYGFNGLKGYSPLAQAREAIAQGKAAELYGAAFFGNGGRISGVLEHPGKMKPETIAAIRESWNAMHQGVGNAHKLAVLQEGAKYHSIGIPPNEAQFIESRQFSVSDVARIYRIPPHMMGNLDRSTHSNIEMQSLEFLIYTLAPYLVKFEAELTRKLFAGEPGYFVRFDERRLIRADLAAKQQWYTFGRQWGIFSANDVRAEEMLPGIGPQGDVYFAPVNMVNEKAMVAFSAFTPGPGSSDTGAKGQAPGTPVSGQGQGQDAGGAGGGAIPASATNSAAPEAMLTAMAPVLADAAERMLRKEAKAAARGKADDSFYETHRQHVAEALWPGAMAVLRMTGRAVDHRSLAVAGEAIYELAGRRIAAGAPGPDETTAPARAREMAEGLIARLTGKEDAAE